VLLKRVQRLDRVGNGFPVGEHPAQPTVVYIVLTALFSGFSNFFLRLAFFFLVTYPLGFATEWTCYLSIQP
jgi:hypothetical protein